MDPTMQQQLLQQLRDIQTPEAIGWWPLAPGWWILGFLILCLVTGLAFFLYRHQMKNAYRREALRLCDVARARLEDSQNISGYLNEVNRILSRTVMHSGEPEAVARLSGANWVDYLNRWITQPLADDAQLALTDLLYQPDPNANTSVIDAEARRWITQHRKPVTKLSEPKGQREASNA